MVLTAHAEPVLADKVLRAGAMAYVVKESATVELRIAIEEALAGRTYLTPLMRVRGAGGAESMPPEAAMGLSVRQRTILGMLREGRTYNQIGAQLGISGRTVEDHIERIGRHVGIRGKAQLIRWSEQFFGKDEGA